MTDNLICVGCPAERACIAPPTHTINRPDGTAVNFCGKHFGVVMGWLVASGYLSRNFMLSS